MTIHIDDCPTPRVEWVTPTEPDRVAHGYHYGREILIDHVPDSGGIAVWRIRVHRGTSHVECERIHRGCLDEAKELAAWIACDLSRRDDTGMMLAVRCGYAILPCSLTHCAIIDPAGNQYDNVLISCAWALIERLFKEPSSERNMTDWKKPHREKCAAWIKEQRVRREHAQGPPTNAQAMGRAMGPANA